MLAVLAFIDHYTFQPVQNQRFINKLINRCEILTSFQNKFETFIKHDNYDNK